MINVTTCTLKSINHVGERMELQVVMLNGYFFNEREPHIEGMHKFSWLGAIWFV